MTSVTLEADIEERLEILGPMGVDRIAFIRQAVLDALDELEDARISEQRLENPGREYSMEEAEQILGLDDQLGRPA